MKPRELSVGFPLVLLRQDRSLLDPGDLDSVYAYYLMENLALGLVRDDSRSPSGYAGGLAESWERLSSSRWAFYLRPDLKWSDGTSIRPADVAAALLDLSRRRRRHILYLQRLSSARAEGRKIVLDFKGPVNEGLVHELSLADAALVHPRAAKDGWRVVSGAYYVGSYVPGRELVLKRNPNFALGGNGPESVKLLPFTMETIPDFFSKKPVDLLKIPLPAFRAANQAVIAHAPQVVKGYPTWLYYLYFDPRRKPWNSAAERRSVAAGVDKALAGVSFGGLSRERQFIPEGFSGRLPSPPPIPKIATAPSRGKTLRIAVIPSFAEATPVLDAVKTGLARQGISVEYVFSWRSPEAERADAGLTLFAGNQKDPLGSWEFMYSVGGDLAPFRGEVAPILDRVVRAAGRSRRDQALRALHLATLSRAYAVPLFIEPDIIAASGRVDLADVNRFDMRLRFYEVRWK